MGAIEEADRVFKKLNDLGHMAECAMTKAIIDYGTPFEQKEPLFLEAIDLCLKGYGEKHLLTTRIYLNAGIAWEMEGHTDTAYDYFIKLKAVCLAVFGENHPKTERALKTLNEPRYRRITAERAATAAGTA